MSQVFADFFGDELCSSSGNVKTTEALKGKTVGIYFSAHWCPPCRGFTPKLAEYYTSSLAAKGLEVVFVSSDNSEEEFNEYFATMPWKALPFAARDKKAALSKKFKVQGIPSFIILDTDGTIITRDGRSSVMSDPQGEEFPWKPKALLEVLGTKFVGQGNAQLDKTAVEGKVLGIYFSAHWCPPCRGFTPQLAKWYKDFKENSEHKDKFEIVFVSSDRDETSFAEYFNEMPWIALPFADRKAKEQLSQSLGVEGIPTFVILDKDGSVINDNGRSIPSTDPKGEEFPWYPKSVRSLEDPDGINDTTSLIVLAEEASAESRQTVEAALKIVADEYVEKAKKSEDDKVLFFLGGPDDTQIIQQIRRLTGLNAQGAAVTGVLLDLADEGAFYVATDVDFTKDGSIRAFLQKYSEKSLPKQQVS